MDTVKLYHWTTQLYSRHVASDKLYNNLGDIIDKFIEIYLSKKGSQKILSKEKATPPIIVLNINTVTDKSLFPFLDGVIAYLMNDIYKHISKEDVDLITLRDEMIAELNQAKYLFSKK